MIALTEPARSRIREIVGNDSGLGNLIRLVARKVAPYRFEYDIYFIEAAEIGDGDVQQKIGELVFVADSASAANLEGAAIDFVAGPPRGSSSTILTPNVGSTTRSRPS